jgi:hypothetical protein
VRVELFAGSVFTFGRGSDRPLGAGLVVYCAGNLVANLTAHLGMDFHDEGGFGESVGEAVLTLRAVADSKVPPASVLYPAAVAAIVGAVTVTNKLNAKSSPAVLAPITDQLGTINWDHGSLGSHHTVAGPPFGPEEGVLDVTMPPFNADNTGTVDATLALQAAIDFSRHNYLVAYFPAGKYIVTNSLKLAQYPRMASGGFAQFNGSSNYCWSRWTTFTVRGESAVSDSQLGMAQGLTPRVGRATLVVKPNTPAFALKEGAATVPLAVVNVSNINSRGKLQPNILMSVIVQSIDVIIGAGNPAAVGMRMRGAQGSSLEDIAVFAADDAFAGIAGCSGSGGSHSNLTVVGARFGIDAREAQPRCIGSK